MLKGKLQSELFYCDHLGVSEHDEQDIMSFTIRDTKGSGLLQYIRYFAFPEEDEGVMRTYIVRDKRSFEMVGYFSLKAGLISYNERDIPMPIGWGFEIISALSLGPHRTCHFHGIRRSI